MQIYSLLHLLGNSIFFKWIFENNLISLFENNKKDMLHNKVLHSSMNNCPFCFITENPSINNTNIINNTCLLRYIYKRNSIINESWYSYTECDICKKYLENSCIYCKIHLTTDNKCINNHDFLDNNCCIEHCGCSL